MKQKTVKKWIALLIAICAIALSSAFLLNKKFLATHAFAEEDSEVTIEDLLTFNLSNGNTEYKVKAKNKLIAEVNIPAKYNGLPVTEIIDNGFTNCTNLTKIRIPHTVKRIGNNAFANCKNLEEINGMPKVEQIGNNAFAMCNKLNNLILPNSINSLGSSILRNNSNTVYSRMAETEMMTLNANWKTGSNIVTVYGNDIVLNEVRDENNNILGYSVKMSQNLNTEADFVLGDTYNGFPLLEIDENAFYCNEFNSFTLKHGEIVADAEASGETVQSNETDHCNHIVNIASGAFTLLQTNQINLLVDVTFNDPSVNVDNNFNYENGKSIEIFSDSSAVSVTLPNNINYIPKSAFANCINLVEIKNIDSNVEINHISSNINTIGSNAFDGCTALQNIYIPQSVTTMGDYVFNQWGNEIEQTIFFAVEAPNINENYHWANYWQNGVGDKISFNYKEVEVTFDKQGGNSNIGDNSVTVMFGRDMPKATAPQKGEEIFDGYYSEPNGGGVKYYDKDMNSVTPWDQKSAAVIYANWLGAPSKSRITFSKAGGSGGTDWVDAIFGQPMPSADKPNKTGYNFVGYIHTNGKKYYDKDMKSVHDWDLSEESVSLLAIWDNNKYNIILDSVGGSGGTNKITVSYDDVPKGNYIPPHLTGYTFDGYYLSTDNNSKKYLNADMSGACSWDIDVSEDEEFKLYAHWTPKNYTVTFDKNGGTGGASEVSNCVYNQEMPNLNANKAPTRTHYEFMGYYTKMQGEEGAVRYYNTDMTSAHTLQFVEYADEDNNITLYAHWKAIQYDVVYVVDNLSLPANVVNNNLKKVSIEDFNENISLPIYSVDNHGYSIKWNKHEIKKEDLYKIEQENLEKIVISGEATVNKYYIEFYVNGLLNNCGNSTEFTAAERVVLNDAESVSEGEYFAGWLWTDKNRIITNLDGIYENITLVATWSDYKTTRITKDNLHQYLPQITTMMPKESIIFDTKFTDNITIVVSPQTEVLALYGNGKTYNLNIAATDRTTDLVLMLNDIHIKAHSATYAIVVTTVKYPSISTLHLYTYSSVSVKGCTEKGVVSFSNNGLSGVVAIACDALYIHRADSLYIEGGDGTNGLNGRNSDGFIMENPDGGNGGDGGAAILVYSDVYIACQNVYIYGGQAGRGGNAANYSAYKGKGGKGALPVIGLTTNEPPVYVPQYTLKVLLWKSADGIDGYIGKEPTPVGPIDPISPVFPPIGGDGVEIPPKDWDIDMPPFGDHLPTPPFWPGDPK